jgi:hypothetical protein
MRATPDVVGTVAQNARVGIVPRGGVSLRPGEGLRLRVSSRAKTIADCFNSGNRLGIDVALDALRSGLSERRVKPAELMLFARICRVDKVIRPLLEAPV